MNDQAVDLLNFQEQIVQNDNYTVNLPKFSQSGAALSDQIDKACCQIGHSMLLPCQQSQLLNARQQTKYPQRASFERHKIKKPNNSIPPTPSLATNGHQHNRPPRKGFKHGVSAAQYAAPP
ncbi:hypothetical protein SD208_03925 [Ochrobactrum sp. BD67]